MRRLADYATLSDDDTAAIATFASVTGRTAAVRSDLAREGDPPEGVLLIVSGWACRYKLLEDGRRQIVSFLLPGDLCDPYNAVLATMDHSIGALTAVGYAVLSSDRLLQLSLAHPRVGKALNHQMLVDSAIQREWTINIGQRNAVERVGSLLCELMLRLRSIGLADRNTFNFPLNQVQLAEATGLTPVHVNRTIQHLRGAGLIEWTGKVLTVPNLSNLQQASQYSPDYLHLSDGYARGDRPVRREQTDKW